MATLTMTGRDTAWTIAEACAHFNAGGIPVTPRQLAGIIRWLPGLQPVAETASGPKGGRGKAMYDIGQLMRVCSANAPWF